MNLTLILVLAVAAILIISAISIYNNLVSKKAMADEAFSGIDVQLKRRTDLIPNLVETVKGYAAHESGTLEKVTALRTSAQNATSPQERFQAEAGLSKALANVFAVAENYPQLRASENFTQLQGQLAAIEDQIQMSRRYYNGASRDLNILIDQFPSNIFARRFRFEKKPYFELENEADRNAVKVDFK